MIKRSYGIYLIHVSTLSPRAECKAEVYVPYAKHLASQDKFDEARQAYQQAGFPQLATKILEQLAHNSVMENRFSDASYYLYQLSIEALKVGWMDGWWGECLMIVALQQHCMAKFLTLAK